MCVYIYTKREKLELMCSQRTKKDSSWLYSVPHPLRKPLYIFNEQYCKLVLF